MGKGKTTAFRKPHNQKSFNLCIYNRVSKKSQKTKKPDSLKQKLSVSVKKPDWFENSFLVRSIARFGVDECYVKQGWSLVQVETKKKLKERFKMLQAKEIDYVSKKTKFLHELASMIAEAD